MIPGLSFISALLLSLVQVAAEEIQSGPFYHFLSKQNVERGEKFLHWRLAAAGPGLSVKPAVPKISSQCYKRFTGLLKQAYF